MDYGPVASGQAILPATDAMPFLSLAVQLNSSGAAPKLLEGEDRCSTVG